MNINIRTREQFPFRARLAYVVRFLNRHPLVPGELTFSLDDESADRQINYSTDPKASSDMLIPAQHLFFSRTAIPSLCCNPYEWRGQTIYSVEDSEKNLSPFTKEQSIQFDIFEAIFYHISRYEEYFNDDQPLNQAGWLREDLHLLVRNNLEKSPVVDQLVIALIRLFLENYRIPPTTYSLSHDLDFLFRFKPHYRILKSIIGNIYHQRGWQKIKKDLFHWSQMISGKVKDPYDTFDWLFLDGSNTLASKHLYIMTGGNTPYDNQYAPSHPYLKQIIDLAISRGYQLGLHPSYNAGLDEQLFLREKTVFENLTNRSLKTSRQHWLRFQWQHTPTILTKLGLARDSSIGYSRRLGFRCGTGFPYYLYDFKKEDEFEWQELPLVLMDSAAIHEAMAEGMDLATLITGFLERNRVGTHVELNFHNSNFDPTIVQGIALADYYEKFRQSLVS